MHASSHGWVNFVVRQVWHVLRIPFILWSLWSDLIWLEVWACALKQTACMHASLCTQVKLCGQTGLPYSPHSIYTLISLIWPNLAEIWVCTRKHIACIHASVHAWVKLCSDRSSMFSWFHIYINISDPTQFGWDMGLSAPENSVYACWHVCTCTDIIVMTSMSPWFFRYL